MSSTWDEYLAEMVGYLSAVRRAAQVGSESALEPPTRPVDPIPDECRAEAGRLSEICDQLAVEVGARAAVIAGRPPSARQNPHRQDRLATYLETDI